MKIDYEDFLLLSKYIEKHCKGNAISIEITPNKHFEVTTTNLSQEKVTVTIYNSTDAGHLLAPTIIKQERLKNCI
jgi:hypothetical protein